MTRNIFLFLGTFIAGALIALVTRAALLASSLLLLALTFGITLQAKADTSPEAMHKMIEAFSAYGVQKSHIEKRIQCRLDAIRPAQIVQLKKVYASLRDGMSAPGDWFEADETVQPAPAKGTAGLRAAVQAQKPAREDPAPDPTPSAEEQAAIRAREVAESAPAPAPAPAPTQPTQRADRAPMNLE